MQVFGVAEEAEAGMVVLKLGRRPRYASLKLASDQELTMARASNLLDSVLGGDARFTRLDKNNMPTLKAAWERQMDDEDEEEEEEEE